MDYDTNNDFYKKRNKSSKSKKSKKSNKSPKKLKLISKRTLTLG